MANSNKEEGRRDEDDHHRPFDYTDSKKEEETTGHAGDGEEGHDDYDYTDSKKEEGHDEHDDRPFDYSFIVLARVADAFLRNGCPEGYACAGEERSPPLQRPQDCSHGRVATKKPTSCFFPEKLSINKKRRVSSPASSSSNSDVDKLAKKSSSSRGKTKLQESSSKSTSSADSDDDTQLLRRWSVTKSRSRCIYSNSGEGTSTDRRLQRDNPAAGADRAAGRHQPPPAPAGPQAGRTWREVHRAMGGSEVVRIGKKTVHRSDTCTHQSRLLLNQGLETQVYEYVLNTEKEKINSREGLRVKVLNYYGGRFRMICRYRGSQKGMVFNSGWSKFLKQHDGSHLKEGESLLLLAFRTQKQRLCFVFVPEHLEDELNLQHQHD